MSTPIERFGRLSRDEQGYIASAELIMALPILMLFWVMMWDFGILQSAKLDLVAENRTAAFSAALGRSCFLVPSEPQVAVRDKASRPISNCQTANWRGATKFWSDLDRAGGEQLTADLARAPQPRLVVARGFIQFRFHPALKWANQFISDRFVVLEPRLFAADEDGFSLGYDRIMENRLSSGHDALLNLFPRAFPKVR